jgi:hypothetical protein
MRRMIGYFLVIAGLAMPQLAFGQDDAAKQQVVKAIRSLVNSEVSMSGQVEEEMPDADEKSPFGGAQRFVIRSMDGSGSNPFLGEFELLVNKDVVAIISQQEFPGIKILQSGEKAVNMQAHAESPYSLQSFSSSIKQLVDWNALGDAVEKSSKVRVTNKDGMNQIRVILDPEFIPVETMEKAIAKKMGGAAGGAGNVAIQVAGPTMNPSIVDLTATFTVTDSGSIVGMDFEVQYNDPLKAMVAGGVLRGVPGVAAIRIGGNAAPPAESDAVELGKLVNYSLKVNKQSSDRIKQFVKEATPYLQSQK